MTLCLHYYLALFKCLLQLANLLPLLMPLPFAILHLMLQFSDLLSDRLVLMDLFPPCLLHRFDLLPLQIYLNELLFIYSGNGLLKLFGLLGFVLDLRV